MWPVLIELISCDTLFQLMYFCALLVSKFIEFGDATIHVRPFQVIEKIERNLIAIVLVSNTFQLQLICLFSVFKGVSIAGLMLKMNIWNGQNIQWVNCESICSK